LKEKYKDIGQSSKSNKVNKKANDNFLIFSSLKTVNRFFKGFFIKGFDLFESLLGLVSGK